MTKLLKSVFFYALVTMCVVFTSKSFSETVGRESEGKEIDHFYGNIIDPTDYNFELIIENEIAYAGFSKFSEDKGYVCEEQNEYICLMFPYFFKFAFPKNTPEIDKTKDYVYEFENYKYVITRKITTDWLNSGTKSDYYFIDVYGGNYAADKDLSFKFVFSCETGLQIIAQIAKIEGGEIWGEPYQEYIGEIPEKVYKAFGTAFGAGQCNSK